MVSATRVVLADDHAPVRASISTALTASGWEVCGEAATAEEAVQLVTELRPDVALLDVHMPGSGITAARRIAETVPATAVVMLTQSTEEDDLFDALRAGASGYLLKDTDPSRLADLLAGVLAGEAALSPRLVTRILDEFRAPSRPRFRRASREAARLSPREWEVMELLGDGLTTADVARRLFLSPTTVRVHVSTVIRKLHVPDRDAAIEMLRRRSED
jgi:DNA-binding NarL/FixJ family response regulator